MRSRSSTTFDDPGCLFAIKWDGVRALAAVTRQNVRLWGRQLVDYTGRYPELEMLRRLPSGTMLDGELVVVRDGRGDFQALLSRHARRPLRSVPFFAEPVHYVEIGRASCRDSGRRCRRCVAGHLPLSTTPAACLRSSGTACAHWPP